MLTKQTSIIFFTYAGYKYRVDIAGEGEQRKPRLRHMILVRQRRQPASQLCGERNAFCDCVVAMYERQKSGLIILMIPIISLFDKKQEVRYSRNVVQTRKR